MISGRAAAIGCGLFQSSRPRRGLSAALLDQFGATVKPGKLEVLDIDDTFCAAHGGSSLRSGSHHDERGFASMHIANACAAIGRRPDRCGAATAPLRP
jgi:hypothetical protein